MSFGERLATIRKDRGLTQADLGKGLGTDHADASKSVVYGWEKDQHFPRVDQLALLCKRLGCSADHLLFGYSGKWPFAISFERFDRLTDTQKGYVDGKLEAAIEKCEGDEPTPEDKAASRSVYGANTIKKKGRKQQKRA